MATDGKYSSMKWEWDRPSDKNDGLVSCISAYDVAVFTVRAGGRQCLCAGGGGSEKMMLEWVQPS
jgi:hypothetical protein